MNSKAFERHLLHGQVTVEKVAPEASPDLQPRVLKVGIFEVDNERHGTRLYRVVQGVFVPFSDSHGKFGYWRFQLEVGTTDAMDEMSWKSADDRESRDILMLLAADRLDMIIDGS